MSFVTHPIPGAEHDIPPMSPEAAEALSEVDPLDPDAISPIASAETDAATARELRSRMLMLRAGAGPADPAELNSGD